MKSYRKYIPDSHKPHYRWPKRVAEVINSTLNIRGLQAGTKLADHVIGSPIESSYLNYLKFDTNYVKSVSIALLPVSISKPDGSSGVKILTNGLSEWGINSADSTSGAHQFRIYVPAGKTLNVNIHDIYNGSGDADLYVKYASPASAIDFDLASSGSTSREQVSVYNTEAGYYYIAIEAYEGFTYENVLLRASY